MITNDTICAISTAPGIGGIAVIRISGKDAVLITERVYKPVRKERLLTDQKPYTLSYGNIIDEKGMIIDEVMVARFVAPHSFTEKIRSKYLAMAHSIFNNKLLHY